MILALDVMGYENDISESIDAALVLIKKHKDLKIILVGDEAKIKTHKQHTKFEIVNSTQVVEMGEDITTTMRKKDSSMYKAIKLVADNQADGVLSAGSTASYVMLTRLLLKLIPGINKASFMCYFPTASKTLLALLDCGANLECSGEDLYQFAKMASIFKKHVEKNENPSISVVNIGTEKHKGYAYHQKADELLSADKSLNYQGFMETREYIYGPRDIAVADGYTGNLMLKAYEGTMKALSKVIKKSFIWNPIGLLFSFVSLKRISATFDYKNHAGAIVLGLRKNAVKTHGSADKKCFISALEMLYQSVKNDLVNKIIEGVNVKV